jgi:flagellar L-ring protein precursor FlgH
MMIRLSLFPARSRDHRPCRIAPILLAPILLAAVLFPSGSVRAQVSLFSDIKAFQVGDVITIRLAERTAAQRESGWQNKSNSRVTGSGGVAGGSALSGSFGVDATYSQEGLRRNESVQSDLLSGTMTALVVEVDPTGNLIIQGERSLNVNGETHLMRVLGTVRRFDINGDNSVLSYQLANASIEYTRAGGLRRAFMKPGTLAGIGTVLVLGAAVFYGTQK